MTKAGRARTTTLILLALVAAFPAFGLWFAQREDSAREEALAPTPMASASDKESIVLAQPEAHSTERVDAVKAAQSIASSVEAAAPGTKPAGPLVEGRVLDIAGRPVADASVLVETSLVPELAVSGTDGSFRFATTRDELRLVAHHPDWRTVRTQVWLAARPQPGFIVVAPTITLNGEVVDQTGAGIPRATIFVQVSSKLLAGFPFDLDTTVATQQSTKGLDRDGRFHLESVICAPGTVLEVRCEAYLSRTIPIPTEANTSLRVVLEHDPNFLSRTIRGIVVRRDGEPATQALVHFGGKQASTNEDGAFELPYALKLGHSTQFFDEEWSEDTPLVAVEAGSQAAILPRFGRVLKGSEQDPPPQKLFLGPPPLSIRGRVLDARREPLADYTVTLVDPTPVPAGWRPAPSAEQLVSGETRGVKTDAQGAFEVGGLFERRYRVQAFSSKTLGRLESADIPAGASDVELVFAADAFVPEITGRIVGRDGSGIGGVRIMLVAMISRTVNADGTQGGGASAGRHTTTTADAGAFRIENVPRHASELRVTGTDLMERIVTLKDLDLERPLVIVVDRARKLRIEGLLAVRNKLPSNEGWPPWDKPKLQLLALDAQQNELRVRRPENSQYGSTNRLELGEDAAEIYTVSEAAVEFVLYSSDGKILGRQAATLAPGGVGVLTWR